jgi:Fibronectin type III domain
VAETVRPRTLLLFAFVALMGAAAAVSPALAAAAEVKLEVNQNCVEANWPCWTAGSGSNPAPALKVTIAAGGEVMFTDHATTAAAVVWIGSAPACTGVPTSAMTNWAGKCTFATSGTYKFESSTLFKDFYNDYTKYEIVVEATHTVTAPTATTLAAEGFKETEATLKGTVNPGGEATEYFFEYGTGTGYGQTTEKATVSASGGNQTVSATLTKLAPGTEYHFRLVAKNKQGPAEGLDRSFKTMSPAAKEPTIEPHAKEPTPSPTPTPTPTPGPISPEPEIAPLVRPLVESSLKLTAPRHGSSVRGSLEIASSGVGGRLEIDLITNSASLAKVRHQKSTSTVVGRLVRSSLYAGKMSFSISLNAKAKRALSRHHKLTLSVQIVLTPVHGAAVTITRSVVLHA